VKFSRLISIASALTGRTEVRYHHVAFILRKGNILSIGNNISKTHPITMKHPYKAGEKANIHAELDSILKLRYNIQDFSGYTMVVMRLRSSGKLGLSKPCVGCQSVMNQLNFKDIYYSTNEQEFVKL